MGTLHNCWALAGQDLKGWVPSAEMCPAVCGQCISIPEAVGPHSVLTVSTSECRGGSPINRIHDGRVKGTT